jgi:hypothetical protein
VAIHCYGSHVDAVFCFLVLVILAKWLLVSRDDRLGGDDWLMQDWLPLAAVINVLVAVKRRMGSRIYAVLILSKGAEDIREVLDLLRTS